MESETYLQEVFLPFCKSYANSNLEMAVRGNNGELFFITDSLSQHLFSAPAEILLETPLIELQQIASWNKFNQGSRQLIVGLQHTRQSVDFLLFDWSQKYPVSHVTSTPLFLPTGEFFAYQSLHRPLSELLVNREIFSRHRARFNHDRITLDNVFAVNLDHNGQIVLALLLLQYSQQDIADYLKCSRSNVAKIIYEQLCPLFKISGYSARLVVDAAAATGLQYLLPKNLLFAEGCNER